MNSPHKPSPPDQPERIRAIDLSRSILVQAPAGSGKTDLLTRRFLRLLAEVDEPGQVVAITFTNAAAAEMRHRILSEVEMAAASDALPASSNEFSMEARARRTKLPQFVECSLHGFLIAGGARGLTQQVEALGFGVGGLRSHSEQNLARVVADRKS